MLCYWVIPVGSIAGLNDGHVALKGLTNLDGTRSKIKLSYIFYRFSTMPQNVPLRSVTDIVLLSLECGLFVEFRIFI